MPRKKLTKAEEEKRVAELIARLKARGGVQVVEVVAPPSDAKLTDAEFQKKFDRDVEAWNARHRAGEFDALPKPRPLFDEPPPAPSRRRKTSYGQGTRMPRKKMTEAEKKAFAAKMAAARAAARAKKITDKASLKYYAAALHAARRRGEGDAYGVEFKSEAERTAWIANMQAARLRKLGVSAEALAAAPAPAKKAKKKRKPKFLAETMAKLGPASSSPRQKKSRTKKARKSAKSQKKRAGTTLAATIKALAPKRKAPKKRTSKKGGKVCFPVGSAAAQAAMAAKGRKKSASKKPKKAKKAAPKRAIRKVEGFVFPHASGSERKCVKCGRLHSLREHWSHKYMHATPRTKHSYLCKRGGFCAFENLSKRDLAQALKIESERSKSKKRQAELALKYYKLMGKIR